jgi:5-formyltetrahydrofolate cyclo-ligase
MTSKQVIRNQGKVARLALDDAERTSLDKQIMEIARTELDWNDYEHVMVYLPIVSAHEINTWPLIHWIWATWPTVTVFVPRVREHLVEAVSINPLTTYQTSSKGILEPRDGRVLTQVEPLDLVICALLGFDDKGHRVGYGGGYYDRFFTEYPLSRRVGLGYEALYVPNGIPSEPHDVTLHSVISEAKRHVFD